VVITGANRGLGFAFAKCFSARGDRVIGTARKPQSDSPLASVAAQVIALDVSFDDSVERFAAQVAEPVDLLINNAGILVPEDFQTATAQSILNQVNVNGLGAFRVTRALLSRLREAEAARVVNITSRMGSIGDNTSGRMYGYRMSKAALNMATVSMSHDLAPISVVAVHPGMVQTAMVGNHGELSADQAVERMVPIIDRLDRAMSGQFLHRDGYEIPW